MISVCVPIASVVTTLPEISSSFSNSGIALISHSLFCIGIWAITSPVTASIAFRTIGALKSFTFSIAALRAFPSIARCIPLVSTISPIHSMNSRANSSSSSPDSSLLTVDGEAIPFFNGMCFLNSPTCRLHHFRLLRIVVFPARKPHTRHTSTSAWSCFIFRSHLGSGTARIYSTSGFVWNTLSAHFQNYPGFFQDLFLLPTDL